jgi:Tfp pilus assembly protein PilV
VELLLVAFVLGVGLLGLSALQVATMRNLAGAWTRLAAATLAGNALAGVLAEAGPGPRERSGKYTGAGSGPWVEWFDRNGQPATHSPAFFTVTLTRSAPAGARAFRATVAWVEGAPPAPCRLSLVRLVRY